jgi:YD repeat-containing protein
MRRIKIIAINITNMLSKLSILFVLILVFSESFLFAQMAGGSSNVTISSPDASSLGRYAMQAPSYSNGLPQASIPIYTIEESWIKWPISLFYNYGGFRVTEEASCVGLGWELSEGSITRIVKDLPDDNESIYQNYEDLDYRNLMMESGRGVQYGDVPLNETFNYTANRLYYSLIDGKPDVYIFNFNGYSGRFLYIDDVAYLLPYSNLKIRKDFENFIMTTPDGLEYTFHPTDRSLTYRLKEFVISAYYTADGFAPTCGDELGYLTYPATDVVTTWRLIKVENKMLNESLSFTYASYPFYDETGFHDLTSITFTGTNQVYNDYVREVPLTQTASSSAYLTTVESKNVKIIFTYNSRLDRATAKALEKIEVFYKGDLIHPVKTIRLDHGTNYFGSNYYLDYSWLKLKKVVFQNNVGMDEMAYTVDYYDEGLYTDHSKKSYAIDHWGYYNGITNNTLVPKTNNVIAMEANGSIFVLNNSLWANRTPNFNYARRYALKKITYPTKGYSLLNYESAGGRGIRVSSIEDYDGEKTNYKFYGYYPDSPVPAPNYHENQFEMSACSGDNCWGFRKPIIYSISGYSRRPLNFYDENVNFYEKVTEYLGDAFGAAGKNEYYFMRDFFSFETFLTKEFNYKYGNPNPIRKVENNYTVSKIDFFQYWSDPTIYWISTSSYCQITGGAWGNICCASDVLVQFPYPLSKIETMRYELNQNWYKLANKTETTDGIVVSTDYDYNNYSQIKKKTTANSKETILTTFYNYPQDKLIENPSLEPYKTMVDNYYMISPVISQWTENNNNLVKRVWSNYVNWGNNIIAPETIEEQNGSSGLRETRIRYHSYDNYGNILSVSKEGDIKTSYIWGYNQSYPVAKFDNMSYAAITSNTTLYNYVNQLQNYIDLSNTSTRNNLKTLNNNIRLILTANVMVSTYTYKPLIGMTSQTDPNGKTTYYEYDGFGRLIYIKDQDYNVIQEYIYHYKE